MTTSPAKRFIIEGEPKGERSAEGMAAEENLFVAEVIEEAEEAVDGRFGCVGSRVFGGIGVDVAQEFGGDDGEALGEAGDVGDEGGGASGEAVEEEERRGAGRSFVDGVADALAWGAEESGIGNVRV
jgi:hypothetical protein